MAASGRLRLGLDLGSTSSKAVLIDAAGALVATRLDDSGHPSKEKADGLAREILAGLGSGLDVSLTATGYGRALVDGAGSKITEITCHAKGVWSLHPDAASILDIGGQDAKAIRLGRDGKVEDFAMNDRCAAGTGRFLEMAARRYGMEAGELSDFCGHASRPGPGGTGLDISATCAVFAESELVGMDARGVPPAEALRAAIRAMARRAAVLLRQAGAVEPLYFTGGTARNEALRQ
ncbi:MAG: acyl-CoA dehydratase activase, partial [Planctomycetota bacterium]|nr:acyl-CoA dehydratase activase [Planctomycetota bacterium]